MYDRGSGEEKEEAEKFYKKFVLEGDKDYDRRSNQISNEEVLIEVGSNFEDVLVVFYHNKNQISILRCYACHHLILGPSFSCLECVSFSRPNTRRRALCCECYGGGELIYHDHHPRSTSPPLLHEQQLLLNFTTAKGVSASGVRSVASAYYERSSDVGTAEEMLELRRIAMMQYEAATPEMQDLAKDFFKLMDSDGDEKIDVKEFLSFMAIEQPGMRCRQLFKQFDANDDGSLDFWEVMTLYYAIKSGRPNCDHCGDFIPGIFFSCVFCFRAKTSFTLCRPCYQSTTGCFHTHYGKTHFLDNYTLLETLREPPLSRPQAEDSSSTTTGRPSGKSKMNVALAALKALDVAVAIFTATGSCTIS